MAVTKAAAGIPNPTPRSLLSPLLPALTVAAVSKEPAPTVLSLLSPILRKRVQFLSATSTEPWLRLLCYDTSKAAKLVDLATNGSLEPHPVSGEIEVDWEYDSETRFRRLDAETLQALVFLKEIGLAFQLVYCTDDEEGGEGWRVGEVTVAEASSPFANFAPSAKTIAEAEQLLVEGQKIPTRPVPANINVKEGEDDDDDYWARYDNTPMRTPAIPQPSPAPPAARGPRGELLSPATAEQAYYSRYDDVQPAMDNHDPDEAAAHGEMTPPLGLGLQPAAQQSDNNSRREYREIPSRGRSISPDHEKIIHPRPESSASSRGSSQLIERLEEEAGRQNQNDFGVKQHISRSVRSLFQLSRGMGISREEFDQLVREELDVLGMVDSE